jgi:ADP-ribose pyrophosphatase YjhB (NUDIX family)
VSEADKPDKQASLTRGNDIPSYVMNLHALTEETTTWFGGLSIRFKGYLTDQMPPVEFVSSVRALVFRGLEVLVMTNSDGYRHIVPGGRREKGEGLEETLRREILEEAGLTIGHPTLLGIVHYHHRCPKPENYPHPYPDFLWVVYMVDALDTVPGAKLPDDYEREAGFSSLVEVEALGLTSYERLFLAEALRRRGKERGALRS